MKPITLNREDIKKLLPKCPKGHERQVFFSDADYALFSDRFLTHDGFSGYKKWLKFCGRDCAKGQTQYWRRNYDCDNLAESYKTYMNMLHAKANPLTFTESFKSDKQNETKAEGVAVGVIYFEMKSKGTSSHHAINVAVTHNARNNLSLIFIEPNSSGKIKLNKQEKESIWYVNF